MKVKCIKNTGSNLPSELFLHYGWNDEMEFHQITIGKEYIVYAIMFIENYPFYMICSDDYDGLFVNYPHLLPKDLFEICDKTKSQFWITEASDKIDSEKDRSVGFRYLFENDCFYGNLVEGYETEVKIFTSIKKLIDEENRSN